MARKKVTIFVVDMANTRSLVYCADSSDANRNSTGNKDNESNSDDTRGSLLEHGCLRGGGGNAGQAASSENKRGDYASGNNKIDTSSSSDNSEDKDDMGEIEVTRTRTVIQLVTTTIRGRLKAAERRLATPYPA